MSRAGVARCAQRSFSGDRPDLVRVRERSGPAATRDQRGRLRPSAR